MRLHGACVDVTIAILVIIAGVALPATRATAQNSTSPCDRTCGTGSSAKRLHYPFGFSSGCEIKLSCTTDNATESEITIAGFRVLNITRSSILVSLPAACGRSVDSVLPLFAPNYAPTWANGFLLQNCSRPPSGGGGCLIPTKFVEGRFGAEHCDSGSDNISCFSPENSGFDVMEYDVVNVTRCKFLFSAVSAVGSDENSLEFQVIELSWWLEGSCGNTSTCAENANCTEVRLPDGRDRFRCECKEGFVGDGFAVSRGCRRGELT